ncbi:MAG: hypothetical protein JWM91_44 [Rhodospirillales bacterium]|nr:hypothetical protein [Rhodospirillales bacterium]
MRVHETAQGASAVDIPTRRMALRAGLCLVAAMATPIPAFAKALATKPNRELSFVNLHTGERLKAEYVHNGAYVPSALRAISVLMRDHHNNKIHPIDPHLIDVAHMLHSRVRSNVSLNIVCGYRSPETNAMMHEISAGVAVHSMHIQGKAMDIRLPGTHLAALKKTALALDLGGVGYYPEDNFLHIDTGAKRHWVA